jgi:NAD(P)-dependent dehydrogenase (short-subunit alcohol dehydrogenase family)
LSHPLRDFEIFLRGEAIVRQLASDGYRVCVNDLPLNKDKTDALVCDLNDQYGLDSAIGVSADVNPSEKVKVMIDQVVKELDKLTLMVANAGICQI